MCSELTNARKEIEKYMEIPFLLTLKAARINKGLSAEEVANKLNIGVKTLYKYEDGTSSPSILTALSMADLYGVPIDMLDFGVNDSSEKPNT